MDDHSWTTGGRRAEQDDWRSAAVVISTQAAFPAQIPVPGTAPVAYSTGTGAVPSTCTGRSYRYEYQVLVGPTSTQVSRPDTELDTLTVVSSLPASSYQVPPGRV
jgi:hypothetical protein